MSSIVGSRDVLVAPTPLITNDDQHPGNGIDTQNLAGADCISLDELGIKFNCDKSSFNRTRGETNKTNPRHDYLCKYEYFIKRFRYKPDFRLLELGIGPDWNMGASLKIWLDYFQRHDFRA